MQATKIHQIHWALTNGMAALEMGTKAYRNRFNTNKTQKKGVLTEQFSLSSYLYFKNTLNWKVSQQVCVSLHMEII